MSDGEWDGVELDLSDSDVVTKYKAAADITNATLAAVAQMCKAGAKVADICAAGDAMIEAEAAKCFRNKDPKTGLVIEKGIAFPVCCSVNSVIGHFSPLADDTTTLAEGDMVKIDLGCHIDGFIATGATTVVAGENPVRAVTGVQADLIACANTCFELAMRLIRPGHKVSEVPPALAKVAEAYGCNLVEGVMTHQMRQFIIDGQKVVLNRPMPDQRVQDHEFEQNEVYAIDIVVSSGEGKSRVQDEKQTTVYKRDVAVDYNVKGQAARSVITEVNRRFPTTPFNMRSLEGKTGQVRLGLAECISHGMLSQYPVLHEKKDALVAQIKGTVLLMPNGSDRITKSPLPEAQSTKAVEDADIKALLATSVSSKKRRNKKKN